MSLHHSFYLSILWAFQVIDSNLFTVFESIITAQRPESYLSMPQSIASSNLHRLETKQLKKLVRDIIEPSRDLGHVDRHGSKPKPDHHTNNNPVVEPQPENQPTSPQRPLPIINNNNPMAINSAAENMVASIMSAHPDRPKNDDRSHQPTPAEVAATQTANKLVADIMNGFQEGVAKSGNREFVGESRGLGMRQEGDMTDDGVDDGSDEVQTVHSARQGCEDCG